MKWRLRLWWQNLTRRLRIRYVLTGDQCWYGFRHTQTELLSWLCDCDLEAQESLHKALGEQIEELRVFRRQGLG
jgi:hypothetical protein